MAFRRNRNLGEIIGQKTILPDRMLREIHITKRKDGVVLAIVDVTTYATIKYEMRTSSPATSRMENLRYTIALIAKANSLSSRLHLLQNTMCRQKRVTHELQIK